MTEQRDKLNPLAISEESQEKAKAIIESAFRDLGQHLSQVADDLAEFNRKRLEATRRMQNGARRTTGRIV